MVYRTEAEAEFYNQKRIYETAYKKHLLDNEIEPVNWENTAQYKHYAIYDYGKRQIDVFTSAYSKRQGTIYTTREESIYEFAKQIGEDNFIKYILIGEYKGE